MSSAQDRKLYELVGSSDLAVVHFDAVWDGYRRIVEEKSEGVRQKCPGDLAFAYVDVDEQPELARAYGVINVPTVVYFRHGQVVASVIGQQQDVAANIEQIRGR